MPVSRLLRCRRNHDAGRTAGRQFEGRNRIASPVVTSTVCWPHIICAIADDPQPGNGGGLPRSDVLAKGVAVIRSARCVAVLASFLLLLAVSGLPASVPPLPSGRHHRLGSPARRNE